MALTRPQKIDATVVSTHPGYVFAEAADGTRYFIFANAIERTCAYDFAYLEPGAQVRLLPIQHPKGPRGLEVEILSLAHPLDGL